MIYIKYKSDLYYVYMFYFIWCILYGMICKIFVYSFDCFIIVLYGYKDIIC